MVSDMDGGWRAKWPSCPSPLFGYWRAWYRSCQFPWVCIGRPCPFGTTTGDPPAPSTWLPPTQWCPRVSRSTCRRSSCSAFTYGSTCTHRSMSGISGRSPNQCAPATAVQQIVWGLVREPPKKSNLTIKLNTFFYFLNIFKVEISHVKV